MAAATVSLYVVSLFFLPVLFTTTTKEQLHNVMEAIERLISYYKESYKDMNVDGVFGLRVLEGQIQLLLSEYRLGRHRQLTPDIIDKLRTFNKLCTKICEASLVYVREDDEEYYRSMEYLLQTPWTYIRPHRRVQPDLKWHPSVFMNREVNVPDLDEVTSDHCMGELTGASHPDGVSCVLSSHCIQTMSTLGLTEYGITHQLLWSMLAELAGCRKQVDDALQGTPMRHVDRLQLVLCTNNYYEMRRMTHEYSPGAIKPALQDLFMEQQFVCPNAGFFEFLNLDYLKQLLSWQKPSGCYGLMPAPQNVSHDSDYDYLEDNNTYNVPEKIKQLQEQIQRAISENNDMKNNISLLKISDNSNVIKMKEDLHYKNRKLLKHHRTVSNGNGKDKTNELKNVEDHDQVRSDVAADKQSQLGAGHRSRRLLAEKTLDGGCLSHKTAVAAGALSMYLRYLIDPGEFPLDAQSELASHQRLLLSNAYDNAVNLPHADEKVKRENLIPVENSILVDEKEGAIKNKEAVQNAEKRDEVVYKEDEDEDVDEDDDDDDEDDDIDEEDDDGDDIQKEEDYEDTVYKGNNHVDNGGEKRVVHFGESKGLLKRDESDDRENSEDKNKKVDDNTKVEMPEDDREYTYYDESERERKIARRHGIIERSKLVTSSKDSNFLQVQRGPSSRTITLLVLASIVALSLFMYRFIRKRRIQIRYRTFLNI